MKRSFSALALAGLLTLGVCASLMGPQFTPGMPVEQVIAYNGPPAIEYPDGNTRLLEWPVGEWSQYAYMARVGPDGKLISYENVRTREKFGTIQVNQFNKKRCVAYGRPPDGNRLSSAEETGSLVISLQGRRHLEFHDAHLFRFQRYRAWY